MPWSDPGGNGNKNDNNPWGRRPNAQKPVFDIQKITQELKKMGGIFGGGRGGGPKMDRKWLRLLPLLVIAVLLLFWIASGIYVVGPDEEGVVLRFGKEVGISQPGLHYRLPFPFERVYLPKVAQSRRLVLGYSGAADSLNPGMMLTADGNVVDVQFTVQYRITNANNYLFATTNPDQLISYCAESAMRELVGRSKMDDLLTSGRGTMERQAQQITQNLLSRYHAGVTVEAVQLLEVGPPKAVQPAFTEVTSAREDMKRARNEAQAYASSVIPKAKGEAAAMVTKAEAYKQQVVDRAKGDSVRFTDILQAYQKNPKVVSERMYLHTMQDILSHTQKVIIESKGQPVIYLHMPAKTPVAVNSPTNSAAVTASGASVTPPVAATTSPAALPIAVSGARS
ncbi:FtsH protease activity modulator HflK [Acidithiobacillus sp.]|jgi:membrane protease subunit HflK|uniref:FtsH protease activity modulator HflK n=1 Tax=Acidithiobacillus sp. TaxID=1872118 RepID=UPI0025BD25FB|nr:FtsH protease activity modulator HflK [Acidithiobacillus sp.]MCK9187562.1 FtsH protease activity modulator HflK [Acidithiobacillus sp.]MCK9358452.1 FtsH protease activity modulator HflK [Acidithiobacillus sp.]